MTEKGTLVQLPDQDTTEPTEPVEPLPRRIPRAALDAAMAQYPPPQDDPALD